MALTEAQHQDRRKSIGGSDAVKIMWGGVAEWRELYNEKVNDIRPVFKQSQIDLMDMGHAMEPLTLKWFEREHHKLRKLAPDYRLTWKVDPFFSFTPDALTLDGNIPVQAKFHTGDKSILDLADRYSAQLLHEMLCTGTKLAYLVVTFGHYGRRQHLPVEWDEQAIEAYLQRAMAFKEYVNTGIEPQWMVEPVGVKIDRRRDHVWDTDDNMVTDLATKVLENRGAVETFEKSLAELKTMVPDDAATATWIGKNGLGIRFKVSRNNAKRWEAVTPPQPARPVEPFKPRINPRAKRELSDT